MHWHWHRCRNNAAWLASALHAATVLRGKGALKTVRAKYHLMQEVRYCASVLHAAKVLRRQRRSAAKHLLMCCSGVVNHSISECGADTATKGRTYQFLDQDEDDDGIAMMLKVRCSRLLRGSKGVQMPPWLALHSWQRQCVVALWQSIFEYFNVF